MAFSMAKGMGEKGKAYQCHARHARAGQNPLTRHTLILYNPEKLLKEKLI